MWAEGADSRATASVVREREKEYVCVFVYM